MATSRSPEMKVKEDLSREGAATLARLSVSPFERLEGAPVELGPNDQKMLKFDSPISSSRVRDECARDISTQTSPLRPVPLPLAPVKRKRMSSFSLEGGSGSGEDGSPQLKRKRSRLASPAESPDLLTPPSTPVTKAGATATPSTPSLVIPVPLVPQTPMVGVLVPRTPKSGSGAATPSTVSPAGAVEPSTTRKSGERRGWLVEEDELLTKLVEKYGVGRWKLIASEIEGREAKRCRDRWVNHIDPSIKKGEWTEEEEATIMKLHAQMGNKWARIAQHLEGRSENAIKNHWNTTMQRRPWSEEEDTSLVVLYKLEGENWTKLARFFPGRTPHTVRQRVRALHASPPAHVTAALASGALDPENLAHHPAAKLRSTVTEEVDDGGADDGSGYTWHPNALAAMAIVAAGQDGAQGVQGSAVPATPPAAASLPAQHATATPVPAGPPAQGHATSSPPPRVRMPTFSPAATATPRVLEEGDKGGSPHSSTPPSGTPSTSTGGAFSPREMAAAASVYGLLQGPPGSATAPEGKSS